MRKMEGCASSRTSYENVQDGPSAKLIRLETIYSLCILCQVKQTEELIKKPTHYDTLLKKIRERAKYGDKFYPEVARRLQDENAETLQERKASWHRSCYQDATHKKTCNQAKERYYAACKAINLDPAEINTPLATPSYTRSHTSALDQDCCFFCGGSSTYREKLHKVVTEQGGKNLHVAIEKADNTELRVKINTAIDPADAHAIDVLYHNKCWTHHVTNVLSSSTSDKTNPAVSELATKIEFVSRIQEALHQGQIFSMSELETIYGNIEEANGVQDIGMSRKRLREIIKSEIPNIEFHKASKVNEPDVVSVKTTRDLAIENIQSVNDDVSILYDAAVILKRQIAQAKHWNFNGTFTLDDSHLPDELQTFFRWVLQGEKNLSSKEKNAEVDRLAKSLAQTTVCLSLSGRQIRNKESSTIYRSREMPQPLAIGLSVRQSCRGKKVVNLLHGFGVCSGYDRLLRLETQIANTLIERIIANGGIYMPPNFVEGRFIFFAIDNSDFAEDTPDGKNTLHATAMAIYQRKYPDDRLSPLILDDDSKSVTKSLKDLPESMTQLLPCKMPARPKPSSRAYPQFIVNSERTGYSFDGHEVVWLLSKSLVRSLACDQRRAEDEHLHQQNQEDSSLLNVDTEGSQNDMTHRAKEGISIPTWAAYNSLISDPVPQTQVRTPPLIPAPAHEWQTLLTVLKQSQGINTKIVGPDHKTVITLDLGLYRPAKQLQMHRDDLGNIILRPGELHVVMAQLRTIGSFIEGSGIDQVWIEADVYGAVTVKQILEGRHVKRGVEAHITTLLAFFTLYTDAFFLEYPELQHRFHLLASVINAACKNEDAEAVLRGHHEFDDLCSCVNLVKKMKDYDSQQTEHPVFEASLQYMQMVLQMLQYIRATRTGNWPLHLQATDDYVKYFFAHDKLNYARLMPLYLADMEELQRSDPVIWNELMDGNWVVNKNDVPFCAIGADHALEQVNRAMKVSGGLIGITQNPNARARFFLVAPELARMSSDAEEMAGVACGPQKKHHEQTASVLQRTERNVQKLVDKIALFTNPFSDKTTDLINLVTKAIMPNEVKEDILLAHEKGAALHKNFVATRIITTDINFWAPMKKQNLKMWTSTGHKTKIVHGDKVIELREDRSLFARMLIVARSRPEIDLQEAIGLYEFSVVPRALFAADGTLLSTYDKCDLLHILEKLPGNEGTQPQIVPEEPNRNNQNAGSKVAIVDGMAEVQCLAIADDTKTCADLANVFIKRLKRRFNGYDEVHLIFDRYDIEHSLKASTREKRTQDTSKVSYHISDTTSIETLTMKRLLATTKTKDQLTTYLASRVLGELDLNFTCVVAWRDNVGCSTGEDVTQLASTQEEADTKILLHAINVSDRNLSALDIFSPDTDVFILAIQKYPHLHEKACFITGTDQRHIPLKPVYIALGGAKAKALTGFHALTGCDVTGRFAGIGKTTCWKAFMNAPAQTVAAIAALGVHNDVTDDCIKELDHFVCTLYMAKTKTKCVTDLRWQLFTKKQAQSEGLPPTKAALSLAIKRAHYQAYVWHHCTDAIPVELDPSKYGWTLVDGKWNAIMTNLDPAPMAIIELVKCGCKVSKCETMQCKCRKNRLTCTDLCNCEECENGVPMHVEDTDLPDQEEY